MYAAVLVTVLAGVPPFGTFDLALRRFFQDLAEIPWEVQRLSKALRQRTWIPEDKFEAEVRYVLHEANFSDEAISFSSERTPQALWTRITVLQKYIETWETRRGAFSGFYFKNTDAIRDLMKDYKDVEALVRRVFPMLKLSKAPGGSQEPDPTQQGLAESFVAGAERLEENLCDFVSHGVLTCGLTARSRSAEFERIGFMVNVCACSELKLRDDHDRLLCRKSIGAGGACGAQGRSVDSRNGLSGCDCDVVILAL